MKRLLLLPAVLFIVACNEADRTEINSETNGADNVEQHSGENITPQLENEGDNTFTVDTISSSGDMEDAAGQ